jgi:hypothetical protein
MREHILPLGEGNADREIVQFSTQKKPHPAATASDLHRELMLVTRTPRVMLAPDLGFEMRSNYN